MSERRAALGIAVAFAAAGVAWVLLTDILLYSLTTNPVLIGRFETAKGWLFVLFSAVVIYVVAHRSAARMVRARAAMVGGRRQHRGRHPAAGPRPARRVRESRRRAHVEVRRRARAGGHGSAPVFSRRFRVSYPNGALVPPDQFASQRVFDEGGPLKYKALALPAARRASW